MTTRVIAASFEKRAYPVMKEAAEFLLSSMIEDDKGRLLSGPSISPENRYRDKNGTIAKLTMSPTMDVEITHALFTRVIEAASILGIDKAFQEQLKSALKKLPPLQIGKHGQLQEWLEDYDEPDPGHRHISHLFALHPGNQITLRGTPDLARAARVSLERRLQAGSGHTGWSRAWIINFWARLEEGDLAHENIVALLAKSTYPNLFDNHPPFRSTVTSEERREWLRCCFRATQVRLRSFLPFRTPGQTEPLPDFARAERLVST